MADYAEAFAQFPQRKNSLIRESNIILNTVENIKEGRKDSSVKNEIERIKNKTGSIPSILTTIRYNNKIYVQNPEDDHQVNNWKCRRIFNCYDRTMIKCLQTKLY
ncbi:hypothetical protein [Lysinibacillus xylanilyticus]|uniref:Uncharacterized protein n=1 Tax=Lysinibacillus xylanilyticus TaxID=582475 RepID=A0ABV3W047_9BACI